MPIDASIRKEGSDGRNYVPLDHLNFELKSWLRSSESVDRGHDATAVL